MADKDKDMTRSKVMVVGVLLFILVGSVTYVTAYQTQQKLGTIKKFNTPLVYSDSHYTRDNELAVEQAVQNERLASNAVSIDKLSTLIVAQDARINAITDQMSMFRGIGIGFGALLGFLQSVQVLLTLQGRKR